jgi:hypothetical protein
MQSISTNTTLLTYTVDFTLPAGLYTVSDPGIGVTGTPMMRW